MSIEDDIARFDWSRIRTYLGYAEMVPYALRGLISASDDEEAVRLGVWIERILLSVAGPCEGCVPVASVLVAALSEMTPSGHRVALGLLSQISAAEITGPAHEQIGAVDVKEIRQAVAGGFQHYVAVLRAESSPEADLYSCIDLMDTLAFYDRSLAAEAIAALESVRTAGRAPDLARSIDKTLDDLDDFSNDSA
ncbi:hypothetical protein Q0Z83_036790 [Actinoplanes sichuanensis]|uniref:Uncharacterized protein n=1 Tax=Actinoplanes sichuanensis TaxID=512349 RepID=A0ABW4AQ79_9ACTN|nr:hypothetical protein [Actinoplanes sichuanensis]BEL05488.1 hypothetical protein Q0Z83_036790 [Actinoplanes sichuanensis]